MSPLAREDAIYDNPHTLVHYPSDSKSGSMQWLTSTSVPLSSKDGESNDIRGYLMVIRTFCQPEPSEPVDTQRLTSSSTPLSSRDGESDDMREYLMVIRTFCQPEASEPIDTQRLMSSSTPFVNQRQARPLIRRD